MKAIRNSVKAIIIKDSKILLTKNKDNWGVFYLLPGGGQEKGENMHCALKRECLEEISSEIVVKDIVYIREYIGKNHEFAKWDGDVHQVEYMFECELLSRKEPVKGHLPDNTQIGVEWVDINKLNDIRLYPSIIKQLINEEGVFRDKIYLGDTN